MAKDRSLQQTLRYAWDEGLARHVVISRDGRSALDLPLTAALVLAVFLPPLVAIGAVVTVMLGYRIEMRRERPGEREAGGGSSSNADETATLPEEDLPFSDAVHGDDPDPPGTASPDAPG